MMKARSKQVSTFLPYGRQQIRPQDIDAVTEVLQSPWLTQGPRVPAFEEALATYAGAEHAVACASGTAALHLCMLALGVGEGDLVLTSPNTFLATANCARYVGAEVGFVDIDARTGLMDPQALAAKLETDKNRDIKAVIPVHFAGQPAELAQIFEMTRRHGASVVDDACHAIGADYEADGNRYRLGGNPHADASVFSFHPVKHVATGEGGAVLVGTTELAERLRLFRNHGIRKDNLCYADAAFTSKGDVNPWYYEMSELGFNYRLSDIGAALGMSQLANLDRSMQCRREVAQHYRDCLVQHFGQDSVRPLDVRPGRSHAYHLFVVLIDFDRFGVTRAEVMNRLREDGIGTQVHYIPVHLQPYYRNRYGTKPGDFPQAESYYDRALSLPMYPQLTRDDCVRVVGSLEKALMTEG